MSQTPRVRFAPSPTGLLHIGGARTALYNWAFARRNNGAFILRIDDTDKERSTEENTEAILASMKWLGLDWDEGPGKDGDFGPYFQTERFDLYTDALNKLIEADKVYPCFCTPEELEQARNEARKRGDSFQGYNRTCRSISKEEAQRRIDAGESHVWRIKVPDDKTHIEFEDAVHGKSSFGVDQLDDFVIVRSDKTPTYNFATVVDDALMNITHVIRGDDHLSNTPRQIIVYEALEAPVPVFAHLPMIHGHDGKRLSKRHGATSVEEYRDKGFLPETLLNYLALLGWSLDGETTIISQDTLAKNFSFDRVSKNPAVFDDEKLTWMNGEYIKAMEPKDFAERLLMPQLEKEGLATWQDYEQNPLWFQAICPLVRERIKLAPEVIDKVRFLFLDEPIKLDEKSVRKNLHKEGSKEALEYTIQLLENIPSKSWNANFINETIMGIPEKLDLKKKIVFQSIRVAIEGSQVSPPLAESIELLGKEKTLQRLRDALPETTSHE